MLIGRQLPKSLSINSMNHQDIAIIIAWPDQTARGDEAWMAFFKRIGIVKNLNFKVGHAAIVLIERQSGACSYYDFGRYITPRGYGRARSSLFDPRLHLETRATWNAHNEWNNLLELLEEMDCKAKATHGGGRMYFSISEGLNYQKASQFAQSLVDLGPILYGAVAPHNNSCSRYVAQILLAGWDRKDPRRKDLLRPESLKPSPMSNVVNGVLDRKIFCWFEGQLTSQNLNRWKSLRFQIDQLAINLSSKRSKLLPSDTSNGNIDAPKRPFGIPLATHWLGGLGEGAWFQFEEVEVSQNLYKLTRYDEEGTIEYTQYYESNDVNFSIHLPWKWTYMIGSKTLVLRQGEEEFTFTLFNKSQFTIDNQNILHKSTQWN
jgi:hypothetical protein